MNRSRVLSTPAKEALVRRMESGEQVSALSKEVGVLRKSLYEWAKAYRAFGAAGLNRKRGRKVGWKRGEAGRAASAPSSSPDAGAVAARPADELIQAKARIAEFERLIGRQQADLHFFREALRLWDATTPNSVAPASTRSSKN
jgi:transposase-like protein